MSDHPDPEILVMSNAVWSLHCKPNQTMALEEYYVGIKRFKPVTPYIILHMIFLAKAKILKQGYFLFFDAGVKKCTVH